MNKSDRKMKIVAGMGTIDDYPAFVAAGADEIFVGYVPFWWMQKYGTRIPLNRREVLYYNVQIGSYSELMILQTMVEVYKIPVTITLNYLSYPKESYQDIILLMQECMQIGFYRYIIADPDFLAFLNVYQKEHAEFVPQIVISGEYGEMNEAMMQIFVKQGAERVIFPRQTCIDEIKEMISGTPSLEYEAFVLNEKCHYTGAYCNSLHCDELCHMCKIPYKFVEQHESEEERRVFEVINQEFEGIGASGCGLCALWQLKDAGISCLKVVSRGNSMECTVDDIKALRAALNILETSDREQEYCRRMKEKIFPQGCSRNCYYSFTASEDG